IYNYIHSKVIKSIGQGVLKEYIYGIHVDEEVNVVYVGEWNNGCVFIFYIDDGRVINQIGSKGVQDGQLNRVTDVTLTSKGHLLALDSKRLQLFNKEGSFEKVLVKAGDEDGKVRHPHGVVVDEDDNIIISSKNKLQLFKSDGKFIKRIDKPEDSINNPHGLSIIPHHPRRLAVANGGDKTVKILNY
ncbi:E3 ubiquitin-protein ligase TRIM71-like, partial [Anneissia japonica]|uniref:E3 ubiquitin-protein ligase TRIM71-like n=1 Tax=Anneissia japonica TaxID=1529436 RepID=UPI001425A6D2